MAKMPDQNYWIKRAEAQLIYSEKSELQYEKDLLKAYQGAKQQVTKEIDAFYGKYATEGKMTLAEAKKKLNPKQLKEFQKQAKVYLDEVDNISSNQIAAGSYKAYLKGLSSKAYISKLDEITMNIRHQVEKLAFKQEKGLGDVMSNAYEDNMYMKVFDVQKQAGFGIDFTSPGKQQLETAVRERWIGTNYSDSIWNSKENLTRTLSVVMSQEFVRGHGSAKVAQTIADKLDVSYNNAKRLARTELNYIANKGTMKGYELSGVVPEYEYVATLDARTSEICQDMDGKVIPVKEAKPGVNQPPLHPYCRSTTIPHFEDDEISSTVTDRVAKDAKGKTYKVGKDTTYKEWVNGHATADYAKKVNDDPLDFADIMPPPLDIKDYSEEEYKSYLSTADTLLDKYSQKEIIDAAMEWKVKNLSITPALAYGSYDVAAMAKKIGVFDDMTDWFGNPMLVNMKLHGYTKEEAFAMVLTGEPTSDVTKWAHMNGIQEKDFYLSIKDALYSGGSAFTPEEMLKFVNGVYKEYEPNLESKKTFFDVASKKDSQWQYDVLYKELKSYYGIVAIPASYLNDVLKGKYATLAEAKEAKIEYQKKIDAASKAKKEKAKLANLQNKQVLDNVGPQTIADLEALFDATDFEYSRTKADDKYRPWTANDWTKLNAKEKRAGYKYTSGSGAFNRPLAGYEGGWGEYNYKGHGVDLNYEGEKDGIINLYKAIDKTNVPETIKVRRGGSYAELFSRKSGVLRHLLPPGSNYGNMSDDAAYIYDNPEKFQGQVIQITNFLSTGIAKDAGFSGEVEYRILLPKGSKATYAEPYSHYGGGEKSNYAGSAASAGYVGSEAEIIIQAGTQYIIKDIKRSTSRGSLYIELMVIPESQNTPPEVLKDLV